MAEQEILETDVNRLVSQPFRSANSHLQNAALELENVSRQQEHVEYARLDFIKASDLDAPLPAARAAFYVGLCHHLRHEPKHELLWYERSLSMLSEVETKLEKKRNDLPSLKKMLSQAAKLLPSGAGLPAWTGKMAVLGGLIGLSPALLPLLPLLPLGMSMEVFCQKVADNLDTQLQIVRDHKQAIQVVIDAVKAGGQAIPL